MSNRVSSRRDKQAVDPTTSDKPLNLLLQSSKCFKDSLAYPSDPAQQRHQIGHGLAKNREGAQGDRERERGKRLALAFTFSLPAETVVELRIRAPGG